MTASILLSDRTVISVSGPEACSFLQGLITNDAASLAEGAAMYAALLTPQGKILFDFVVLHRGGEFLLDCATADADDLIKRLTLYRLRSKVMLQKRDDLAVLAAWGTAALPASAFPDPRLDALGHRAIIIAADAAPANEAESEAYLDHRLGCGVPEAADFGRDRVFALDGGLDELRGVSFDKGCYVGQELTARMKHRGTARKRILPIATADGGALAGADTSLLAGNGEIGAVLSCYGSRGFALVRLDRLADAQRSAITVAGTSIRVVRPAWLSA